MFFSPVCSCLVVSVFWVSKRKHFCYLEKTLWNLFSGINFLSVSILIFFLHLSFFLYFLFDLQGGFSIKEEMCVNYVHYYPAVSLEVCKSSADTTSLQRFFTFMNKWVLILIEFSRYNIAPAVLYIHERVIKGTKVLN